MKKQHTGLEAIQAPQEEECTTDIAEGDFITMRVEIKGIVARLEERDM